MKGFLAVSVGPDAAAHLRRPVDAASSCLVDDTAQKRVDVADDGWVAFAGADDEDLLGEDAGAFTVRMSRLMRTRDEDLSTADAAAMIAAGTGLAGLLPPFAVVHRAGRNAPVQVAGDWLGYRQLYWWQGRDAAAVSTSARALAVLAGGGLDHAGLGALAMMGWQIGDRTVFDGVRVVPPGTIASLEFGSVRMDQYIEPVKQHGPVPGLEGAVEEMADILSRWQASYLDDHPDTVLQLTGGHDSRILLGAIPEKRRAGLRALTLGADDSPDVLIAAQLSDRYGLRHQVSHLDDVTPTPAEAHDVSLVAARALECLASPMALAPLLLVEVRLEQGHRLSGLGGEVARGFYYAGQPGGAQTSSRLIDRLARWRVFTNEAVEAAAMTAAFRDEARDATLAALDGMFPPGDWLRATDEFYLYQRMRRWSGVHGSASATRRYAVNPMLDRRFIELALALAPADKRDSLLLGRLMTRLDPDLARIPLDSGLVPARLGRRDVVTRLAIGAATSRKAARKVRQRMAHARKPQLGAAQLAELVLAHWRAEPSACHALYDVSVLDSKWLDGVLAGSRPAAPTTVAFLVNLLAAAQPSAAD